MIYQNYDSIEQFVFQRFSDFIAQAINERPWPEDEGVVIPKGPFISLKIVEISPVSNYSGYTSDVEQDDGLQNYYSSWIGSMRITAFGKGAMSKIQSINVGLYEDQLRMVNFNKKGISVLDVGSAMDTSYSVGTSIEKRAESIITFMFVQGGKDRGTAPGIIENVTFDPEYND